MQNLFSLRAGNFVEHKIASSDTESITAIKFEYLLAGNGLFIRAKRQEFSICLPLCLKSVKGLPETGSGIVWHKPKIPACIWREIWATARRASDYIAFREDVFVIYWSETESEWKWRKISRERSWAATIADDTLDEYKDACIELHTHPPGAMHFSRADDEDETGKFRLFGILIDIHTITPKIRFRCGVYEYFVQIPAGYVSEMPAEIVDLNVLEQTARKLS